MGSIAVICLAYLGDPRGVERLAWYFSGADVTLFLHVDAKAPFEPYARLAESHDNVVHIATRHPIYWGGFSIIDAVLSCLRHAMRYGRFERFLLVTEDSMPLVSKAVMLDYLSLDREYIEMNLASEAVATDRNWITDRYNNFYCFDGVATNPRVYEVPDKVLTEDLCDRIVQARDLIARGKYPLRKLYHGPSWWGLSAAAVDHMLLRFEQNPWLVASFRFSANPDEQFFHTLLAVGWLDRPRARFMHADFSREPKPYVYRRRKECQMLQSTGALFARKADIGSQDIDAFVHDLAR